MILRAAVPGSLLEMQNHRSHPRPLHPNLHFSKAPGTVVPREASFYFPLGITAEEPSNPGCCAYALSQ